MSRYTLYFLINRWDDSSVQLRTIEPDTLRILILSNLDFNNADHSDMSGITEKLRQIEALGSQIEAKGKLPDEVLRRIEYRFREETNYHSNRQEGGTLTREETRSVMTGNITVEGKPLKDILEMQKHDQVTLDILRIGRGEVKFSEKRIKDIHREIIVEENPEEQQHLGAWKTEPNHIINSRLERHDFTPPGEVPEAIHRLLDWLNAELEKVERCDTKAIHPAVLAFEFHHRFLAIHPFYDGNGRTARLLSNLLLVSCGYPPFFITDEEKDVYNRYLTDIQGYGGSPELFIEFMLGLEQRSLQMMLDVIEGRDLDDWEKRLSLLTTQLPAESSLQKVRSKETLLEVVEKVVFPVLEQVLPVLIKFKDLFVGRKMTFGTGSGLVSVDDLSQIQQFLSLNLHTNTEEIKFEAQFEGFNRAPKFAFDVRLGMRWYFQRYDYAFYLPVESGTPQFNRPYHHVYSAEEIKDIARQAGSYLTNQIEQKVQEQLDGK